MSFDPLHINLPITEIIPSLRTMVEEHNTLIIHAPPGAGKSTLLPLALLDQPILQGKKIIMLEPRRLAAKTIAAHMASLLGEEAGQTIGYRIRFESRISNLTKIEVVTEGILTRMLHSDNALEEAGIVIFDEFHERSLHADLALALCREAQQVLRPDLRIIIMSATLNMPELTALLKAPALESKGRQYPVEIKYGNDADSFLLPELMTQTVIQAIAAYEGDVLVFLPGEGEIKRSEALLKERLPAFAIHPLYGRLSHKEQHAAIMPDTKGKRKIVLATSIAETSLTIEGIRIVVDSGFTRVSRFDPGSGLSRLETVRISKDSADQRAGRAGRLNAGVCYRLWTAATHQRLSEHSVPEIMEADLTSLVLDMAQWGVSNIMELTWLTPPPKAALAQASDTLHRLDALENGRITAHGKKIHGLTCHPRIAHMLLMAGETKAVQLGTDIAALLEERDPLPAESGIDINLRIEALRRSRKNGNTGGAFARIEKVAASYRNLLSIEPDNGPVDVFETGLLLAYAYPERIAFARPGNNAQFQLANGKYASAGHKDDLAHEAWLAVANMDLRNGLGKIFLAAPLNPSDLKDMVKEQDTITWDTRRGGLIATRELKIGSIVLQSKALPLPSEAQRTEEILNVLKTEGENLLDFNEHMVQLQNRILSLRVWEPNAHWPDVTINTLLDTGKEWLSFYLKDVKKPEDLKKIDLAEALLYSFTPEQQKDLNLLAPSKLEVPSGSKIGITYFPNGSTPVLSVRLQEVFGLDDTPAVNNGKQGVVMHLLSPGYKPVQVTSDLRSFWKNAYFEVKSELKRRYPKHSWPDNPMAATPVAKGRSTKK